MTDQQRPSTGYRGSLPPRRDRLAAPWVVTVIAVFVLMFVLAFLGLPSRLIPEPSLAPLPSFGGSQPPSSQVPASVVPSP